MEALLKKEICAPITPQSPLSLHKNSHVISKTAKPKIRIIHIFAPEIIKTDAANFRELVQRLTGKSTDDQSCRKITSSRISRKKESRMFPAKKAETDVISRRSSADGFRAAGGKYSFRERIKGEEEIWSGANSGGGFLGGFAEFECGFMQELNDQYLPFLEATAGAGAAAHAHHQMDVVYGESQSQLA